MDPAAMSKLTPAEVQSANEYIRKMKGPGAAESKPLAADEGWRKTLDLDAFKKEIDELGQKLRKSKGPEDKEHLEKMLNWQRAAFIIGLGTCWTCVNPVSIFLISLAVFIRWTMIGHHVCHGGYDKLKGDRYNRRNFGLGAWRRLCDWMDWLLPEAWNVEHNQLHHYQLNETGGDPDLVEDNVGIVRTSNMPLPLKYIMVAFFTVTWKWFYYAPNTYKTLKALQYRQAEKAMPEAWKDSITVMSILKTGLTVEVFVRVFAPFFIYQFVVLPAPFYFIGAWAWRNAIINLVLAELLTNFHAFLTIVTNHSGEDMYRFDTPCAPRSGDYYLRQVLGSANYRTGGDLNDMMHGFLNYQVEHHLWPDLTMRQYQKSQPIVKAICEKHGIPYTQESVFIRLKKTVDIMVGNTSMRRW